MHFKSKESSNILNNIQKLKTKITLFSNQNVTPITMTLNGSAAYPQACQALSSMLSRNTLNPADITVLFRCYSTSDPPPIDLVVYIVFIVMLYSKTEGKMYVMISIGFFLDSKSSIFGPSRRLAVQSWR